MSILSDFDILKEQFSHASRIWSNVESVLISYPEDQPEPSDILPQQLQPQYAVSAVGEGNTLAYVVLGSGMRGDTSQFRYRSGSANMLITRRRVCSFGGDPLVVSDPDDETKCYDRWKTLATVAAGKLDNLPSGTLSENTLGWRDTTRWALAIHELLKHQRVTLEPCYTYEVIRDVFLASAQAINMLQEALPTIEQTNAIGFAYANDIMDCLQIPQHNRNRAKARLTRLRKAHPDDQDLFQESEFQGRNQPRILWNVELVRPHLEDLASTNVTQT